MSGDGSELDPELSPEVAFETLGHEIRLSVVEELARRQRANSWTPVALSFSELRRAVGVDDAGKFNYHLGKLQGRYVRDAGDDDGYTLTPAGFEVASAVRRGTYTGSVGPVEGPLDRDCPGCGEQLTARYEDGYLGVYCSEDGLLLGNSLPPAAAVGRELAALVSLADRESRRYVRSLTDGVCPECYGRVDATLPATVPEDAVEPVRRMRETVVAEFECHRCELDAFFPAGLLVVDHPAVVALYHDHDRDVREHGSLDLEFVGDEPTVLDGDPSRVRVDVELGRERLELFLSGTATVVETRRVDAGDGGAADADAVADRRD